MTLIATSIQLLGPYLLNCPSIAEKLRARIISLSITFLCAKRPQTPRIELTQGLISFLHRVLSPICGDNYYFRFRNFPCFTAMNGNEDREDRTHLRRDFADLSERLYALDFQNANLRRGRPPLFTGRQGERFRSWLEKFDRYANNEGWNEDLKLQYVALKVII